MTGLTRLDIIKWSIFIQRVLSVSPRAKKLPISSIWSPFGDIIKTLADPMGKGVTLSPRLALHLLGPPRLELDNSPVTIDRRKTLALLAYLAVNRGPHTRDYLSALLFPDYDQSKAFMNLRHTLWETQQAIGEGWIVADHETIGLIADSAD